MKLKVLHIVVAAGSGSRFGAELPKQFCLMNGIPVVMHAINALRQSNTGEVVLVLNEDMKGLWVDLCAKYGFDSPEIAFGGATRWQSVKNAVDAFGGDADVISVHDGARPLLSSALIGRLMDAVEQGAPAVIPVVAVTDSLRKVSAAGGNSAVERKSFRAVQTPQVFDGALLRRAYSEPESPLFTDDASVVENIGMRISLVEGEPTNIKITHPLDLAVAELIQDRMRN